MLPSNRQKISLLSLLIATVMGLTGCQTEAPKESTDLKNPTLQQEIANENEPISESPTTEVEKDPSSSLETPVVEVSYDSNSMIHFIDTGQSDAILIENDGHYALIDTGDTNDDQLIQSYLTKQGVQTLDYLILTHVHADHIGAADTVIKNFNVLNTFVSNDEATTKVYREYIEALADKGLYASVPLEASVHPLGLGTLTFYNTAGTHSDTNDKSLVVYYQNGDDTALFTGDAGTAVEIELPTLPVDLYKAGHHGSSTSSSEAFVKRIQPSYVAITVGEGNSYYHPHHRVVELFESLDIPVYRTDEQGTLLFTSTGKGIQTDLTPASYQPGNADASLEKNEGESINQETSSGQSSNNLNHSTNVAPEANTSNQSNTSSTEEIKVYQNCKQLNQDYPHGINKWDHPALYQANQGRDRDKDGYACER